MASEPLLRRNATSLTAFGKKEQRQAKESRKEGNQEGKSIVFLSFSWIPGFLRGFEKAGLSRRLDARSPFFPFARTAFVISRRSLDPGRSL
jgi:hypothetical protein